MKIGFIGLGNLGSKLASSLLRNGVELVVRDLNETTVQDFLKRGARTANSPKQLTESCEAVITCLPSPTICAAVMEATDGVLAGLSEGKLWLEMSTSDEQEVRRLAALVQTQGAIAIECPVSGGCHRAATGNISIFCGCSRATFKQALPILALMGRRILHSGELGSASKLKVLTNYLASVNLVAIGEAFAVAQQSGLDLNTTYEAIRISSGNSFVHETESQVILNGSYDIGFTLDLVQKDMGLFIELAQRKDLQLELAPVVLEMFNDAAVRYGSRALSPRVVQRNEEAVGNQFRAAGFPPELIDDEPEQLGYEVVANEGDTLLASAAD